MSRLYIRIYLAVLGSLLVFALLAGITGVMLRVFDDDRAGPDWRQMETAIVERLLPAAADPAALAKDLRFWHEQTGFALTLLAPDGHVVAQAGEGPQARGENGRGGPDRRSWRDRWDRWDFELRDGRRLLAVPPKGDFTPLRHFRWLAALLGIGLAVGIAAYPFIRYLTRRLERLEHGVAAFGAGNLSARVAIKGRDEIARLAATFNASADRIEALLNAHKALLANASHELRSPLSRLRMAIERLPAGADEAASMEIRRNIEELDALVEEILIASRLQANAAGEIRAEPVDLVGLLAEECAPFDAELDVEGGAPAAIQGDARLLRRLFRNLLENAGRYGGAEPPAVTVRAAERFVTVSVCDRGPGVPEAEREKIFEPFYRVRTMPESAGGAGLGLSLVRQIAERHGGSARCLPREGGGSCFEVRLSAGAVS